MFTDYSAEDLSFLLDSKGATQVQYQDTYGEPTKEHMNTAKGKNQPEILSSLSKININKIFKDYHTHFNN